jgi:hypothetical protein
LRYFLCCLIVILAITLIAFALFPIFGSTNHQMKNEKQRISTVNGSGGNEWAVGSNQMEMEEAPIGNGGRTGEEPPKNEHENAKRIVQEVRLRTGRPRPTTTTTTTIRQVPPRKPKPTTTTRPKTTTTTQPPRRTTTTTTTKKPSMVRNYWKKLQHFFYNIFRCQCRKVLIVESGTVIITIKLATNRARTNCPWTTMNFMPIAKWTQTMDGPCCSGEFTFSIYRLGPDLSRLEFIENILSRK